MVWVSCDRICDTSTDKSTALIYRAHGCGTVWAYSLADIVRKVRLYRGPEVAIDYSATNTRWV